MSGFRLKLNRLRNTPYADPIQGALSFEIAFETEYYYNGKGAFMTVRPIIIHNMVIFLVIFPEGEQEALALVYNKRDTWSDIEKESTALTEAVGGAIEHYYSHGYSTLSDADNRRQDHPGLSWESPLLN